MQAPIKRRKKRGKLYFSSTKALKTSRMGRKKVAPERYETNGINKVLDFEDTTLNATFDGRRNRRSVNVPAARIAE